MASVETDFVYNIKNEELNGFTLYYDEDKGGFYNCRGYNQCNHYDWREDLDPTFNLMRIHLEINNDLNELWDDKTGDDIEDFYELIEVLLSTIAEQLEEKYGNNEEN